MDKIPAELLVNILKNLPGDDLSAMKNVNNTLKQFMHKHRKSLPPQKPWVDIKVLKERVFDRVPRQVFTIITRKGEFNVYFGCYGIVYNRDKPLTWRFFREYDKQVAKLPFRLHFTTFFEYLFSRVNIDQLIFEIPLFTEVEKPFNDVLTSSGCIVKNVVVNPYTWVLWDELYECYLLVIGELKKRPKLRINSDDTWFKRFTHGSKNKIHYLNRLGERFSETVVHFSWEHFYYVMFTLAEIWSNPDVHQISFVVKFEGDKVLSLKEAAVLQQTFSEHFFKLDILSNADFEKCWLSMCSLPKVVLTRKSDKKSLYINVMSSKNYTVFTFNVSE